MSDVQNAATSNTSEPDFAQIYSKELEALGDLGYSNSRLNLDALKLAKGNVNIAVGYLTDWSAR
ncbi:hypothetical protein ACIQI7_10830 [Kitasatospora sp. NPDC092039]|uniref:hypothetical protein n=1 Tax=Kitasatospora sp. NPDC092039 TaxID=3364086 RepID=UPI0037F1501E